MRRNCILLIVLPLLLLNYSNVLGAYFRAEVTNDSTNDADKYFTINLYCTNNDTIRDDSGHLIVNRGTWSSPFTFTGTINIQWLDTTLNDSIPYFSDEITQKYAAPQFNDFWDAIKLVYVESWDNSLPDKFNYTGIYNGEPNSGYPPGLGEIKVLSWHAKTTSTSGELCVEQGNMQTVNQEETYDWLFDDPAPSLLTTCWVIEADTFALVTVPSFTSKCDTLKVLGQVSSFDCPIPDSLHDTLSMGEDQELIVILHAFDAGGAQTMTMSASNFPLNSSFMDQGSGVGRFYFHPSYYQGLSNGRNYNIFFSVTDGDYTASDTLTIKVVNINQRPVLDSIIPAPSAPEYVQIGKILSFTVYGSDPDTENVTLLVDYFNVGPGNTVGTPLKNPAVPNNASFVMQKSGKYLFKFNPDASQANLKFFAHFRAKDPKGDENEIQWWVRIVVSKATDVDDTNQGQLPSNFDLAQNYPNPFNSSTVIQFALPSASRVQLDIFNILGQKVKSLVDQELPAGVVSVTWDGRNETGNNVASGVYFYRMVTRDFQSSKKLLLLK